VRAWRTTDRPRLDLAEPFAAVEDAAPVAAGDVLDGRLTDALGGSHVFFLIADFSGPGS
jgi:hypothetical protein